MFCLKILLNVFLLAGSSFILWIGAGLFGNLENPYPRPEKSETGVEDWSWVGGTGPFVLTGMVFDEKAKDGKAQKKKVDIQTRAKQEKVRGLIDISNFNFSKKELNNKVMFAETNTGKNSPKPSDPIAARHSMESALLLLSLKVEELERIHGKIPPNRPITLHIYKKNGDKPIGVTTIQERSMIPPSSKFDLKKDNKELVEKALDTPFVSHVIKELQRANLSSTQAKDGGRDYQFVDRDYAIGFK